jgi:hypothetical protein
MSVNLLFLNQLLVNDEKVYASAQEATNPSAADETIGSSATLN